MDSKFQRAISSQSVESLKKLFNALTEQSQDARLLPYLREEAKERAAVVKGYIPVRKTGGAMG